MRCRPSQNAACSLQIHQLQMVLRFAVVSGLHRNLSTRNPGVAFNFAAMRCDCLQCSSSRQLQGHRKRDSASLDETATSSHASLHSASMLTMIRLR